MPASTTNRHLYENTTEAKEGVLTIALVKTGKLRFFSLTAKKCLSAQQQQQQQQIM